MDGAQMKGPSNLPGSYRVSCNHLSAVLWEGRMLTLWGHWPVGVLNVVTPGSRVRGWTEADGLWESAHMELWGCQSSPQLQRDNQAHTPQGGRRGLFWRKWPDPKKNLRRPDIRSTNGRREPPAHPGTGNLPVRSTNNTQSFRSAS